MAVCPIRIFPDSCLTQDCQPITYFDSTLLQLIEDLKSTMFASPGVGLAAPQIGVLKKVSVIDVGRTKMKTAGTNHGLVVLINPKLIEGLGLQTPREGCLSVPDMLANVRRYHTVIVESRTPKGDTNIVRVEGFEALAFQHEMDHVQGKLFLDRVTNVKTDIFRRKSY